MFLIPVIVVAAGLLHVLIDPEMARGHADYVRGYRLLEIARTSVIVTMAGLVLLLRKPSYTNGNRRLQANRRTSDISLR